MDPRMMDSLMMGPGGTMGHWGMGGGLWEEQWDLGDLWTYARVATTLSSGAMGTAGSNGEPKSSIASDLLAYADRLHEHYAEAPQLRG